MTNIPVLPDVTFAVTTQGYSQAFQQAMQIYRAEFEAAVRLPIVKIRRLLSQGQYRLVIAQEHQAVLGMALVWGGNPPFVHLDYLAVAHEQQGRGLGTALYRWLAQHLPQIFADATCLTLEVEDHLIPFYQRSGTKLLVGVPYLFPGPHGPVPMHLMLHDPQVGNAVPGATVKAIVAGLYQGIHGRSHNDPVLCSLLANIPEIVKLAAQQ